MFVINLLYFLSTSFHFPITTLKVINQNHNKSYKYMAQNYNM